MPYLSRDRKGHLQTETSFSQFLADLNKVDLNAGDLNYIFTLISRNYYMRNECYQRYNDIIGALEGCKLELYRRRVAKYEDSKIKNPSNGDVY